MAWTAPRTYIAGEIITASILNTHLRDQLRYLKGLDGVPTIESGLTIDNTDGDERLLLPLLSTSECTTVLNAAGEVAYDEQTNQIKAYDGTAVRILISEADVDDTPVNGATTVPVSSNWAYDFINTLTTQADLPYATAAGTWTRLAKGTTGYFLRQAATAPEWVSGSTVPDSTAGDLLIASMDTERQCTSATYAETKSFYCPIIGTLRIKFDLRGNASTTGWGRIYRNGGAVGTERSVANSASYTTFSEDIAGWSAGDSVQIYAKYSDGVENIAIRNFRLYIGTGGYEWFAEVDTAV